MKTRIAIATLLTCTLFAHPGKLDSRGGHNDHKSGGYHFHNFVPSAPSVEDPAETARQEAALARARNRPQRVQAYFDKYNAGILRWRGSATKRDGSDALRDQVIKRDNGVCILCGDTQTLEVDHARALMNGGASSTGNLFTLCRLCHGLKTSLDRELNNKRRAAGLVVE